MDSPNDVYGGPPQSPPPHRPPRSPWVATGATAVAAIVIAVGVASMSGDGSAAPGAGPGGSTSLPTLPGGRYTDLPKLPADGPSAGSTRSSTRTPTARPTKNDWNTATGDTTEFTVDTWFPDTGAITIGSNPYNHLAKQNSSCVAAEPKMRSLMSSTCVKVIQSVWATSSKTQIGSLSVVSLRDNSSASSLQTKLHDDKSDGEYIKFLTPPSGSGVSLANLGPTWVSTTVSGHYLVIAEVGRADGKAVDADSRAMVNDLRESVMEYVRTVNK